MATDLMNRPAGPLTMSSREIAELTGKRHDHVLRDVENMLATLGQTSPQFWGDVPDSYGRPQRVALLPKREVLILVSGYSAELRAKIIDRLAELERRGPTSIDVSDIRQLAPLALQLANLVQQQQVELAAAAPKVAFHDAVANAEGGQSVNEAAKVLGVGERKLREFLRRTGIFMKHAPLPLQEHVDNGNFIVVERTFDDGKGFSKNYAKALITGRGLQYVQRKLAENGLYGVH